MTTHSRHQNTIQVSIICLTAAWANCIMQPRQKDCRTLFQVGCHCCAFHKHTAHTCMMLCLLRWCMLSGNFLRATPPVCFLLGLERSDFPVRAGALQASLLMSCCIHACLQHIIVMNSEVSACMMSQHVCTADHNIPSLHSSFALPCPSCISYSLRHTQNLLLYGC
jgi:hypothetical protein